MAASSTINVTGAITGIPDGSIAIGPSTMSNTSAPESKSLVSIATSETQITVPSGSVGVFFKLPSSVGTTTALKFFGATGQSAGALSMGIVASSWGVIPLASGATLYAIATTAAISLDITFF